MIGQRLGPYEVPAKHGQRFVMIRTRNDNARRSEIQIVLNWMEELKARAPTK